VGEHEELADRILVGVVTRGALDHAGAIELDLAAQRRRRGELSLGRRQGLVINERDGMVVGEVGAQPCGALGQEAEAADEGDLGRSRQHRAEGDGAVVTAQAQLRRAGRLPDVGVQGGALVGGVVDGRVGPVPEVGNIAPCIVRRVAEDADLLLDGRLDRTGPRYRQVVLGLGDAGRGGIGEPEDKGRRQESHAEGCFDQGHCASPGLRY
jgi:hypothetical protein